MILPAYILFFRISILINQPSIDAVLSILYGIERVNLVLSLLLARVWFCSYRIEDAAFHQIKLHEDLLKFKKASKTRKNRSPKGNMWSVIPVALLCVYVNVGDG